MTSGRRHVIKVSAKCIGTFGATENGQLGTPRKSEADPGVDHGCHQRFGKELWPAHGKPRQTSVVATAADASVRTG